MTALSWALSVPWTEHPAAKCSRIVLTPVTQQDYITVYIHLSMSHKLHASMKFAGKHVETTTKSREAYISVYVLCVVTVQLCNVIDKK